MTIRNAGRGTIAGALAFVMLLAAPVQTLADEPLVSYQEEAGQDTYEMELFAYVLIKPGDSGEAVKSVQRRLADLGYFTNSVTGNYGSLTKEAVRRFQIKCGLTADGIVGDETYERLFADDAPLCDAQTPTPAPDAPSTDESGSIPEFGGVLKVGSTGAAVKSA